MHVLYAYEYVDRRRSQNKSSFPNQWSVVHSGEDIGRVDLKCKEHDSVRVESSSTNENAFAEQSINEEAPRYSCGGASIALGLSAALLVKNHTTLKTGWQEVLQTW